MKFLTKNFSFLYTSANDATPSSVQRKADEVWFCREYWNGDSRDGHYLNGDGYHYFQMEGNGTITKAIEYYETDEGEEHATSISELIGLNWFEFFGFEDDEILESVPSHEFHYIESLVKKV